MKPFLTQLAELMQKDRQEFKLSAVKINNDLVLQIVPDSKSSGKVVDITVPEEDLKRDDIDHLLFEQLGNVPEPKVEKLESSKTETESEEEEEDEKKEKTPVAKQPAAKKDVPKVKPAAKNAPVKKGSKKPEVVENDGDSQHKTEVEEMKQDEDLTKTSLSNDFIADVNAAVKKGDYDLNTTQAPVNNNISEVDFEETPTTEAETTAAEITAGTPIKENEEVDGPSPEDLFKHFMAEGAENFQKRDYPAMVKSYEAAVELKPEDASALKELKKANQWQAAVSKLK